MLGETPAPPISPIIPPRVFTFLQIVAVSGFPTQLVLAAVLIVGVGMAPYSEAGLSLQFIAIVSFLDTALVALLILLFLRLSGELSHTVFFGGKPFWPEFWRGLLFVPLVFISLTALVAGLRYIAPWLQTVPENPLAAFMRDPFDAAIFAVVVMLAGGVREELQRGFILHRSAQYFGGAWVGNLAFGLVFGALHIDQGLDVALAIGLMGIGWGAAYIRRRSVVAGMTNHAGFNGAMVLQQVLASSLGIPGGGAR
ncbi:MAG: CPBP family intramembrane metalloprotease [Acidimicrobiia bacterium]|nr:CPBP family intramembrane metalloprotease [Acidimicrobiia bacterium]